MEGMRTKDRRKVMQQTWRRKEGGSYFKQKESILVSLKHIRSRRQVHRNVGRHADRPNNKRDIQT